ncbi:MAG: hypothetical protein N2442_11140 [Spirochaetes bacterium]|nr:hypothetical protein [Spirochaetota bacterium]
MTSTIQNAWEDYVRSGEGYEILVRSISLYVYQFPLKFKYCSEEDCAEFFLSFHTRIPYIIDHYQEQGKGIEAYLRTCLKWHMKTYLKSKLKADRVQQFAFSEWKLMVPSWVEEETIGLDICESSPPFQKVPKGRKPGKESGKRKKAVKTQVGSDPTVTEKQAKKLLLLSLKAAYDLEDRTIETIAQSIGMNQEVLFHLIEVTRTTLLKKEERFRLLQERRSKLYFRICSLQEEMDRCTNGLAKEMIIQRLSRLKYYFEKLQMKLSHHYLCPTHRKVAEILGIPKGSIDSMLYYLKKGY